MGANQIDQETDILIVGAGAAGLTAALAAHESGAKVTIVEKGDRLGGTAAISGGIIWIADNPHMEAAGIEDSKEEALAYFQSLDHGEMDPETLNAFVDQGPETVSFLTELNALKLSMLPGYPDYYLDRPGAKPGGGRALDNELFDFPSLGIWSDKVYDGGEIPRMMLRETPLGGASGLIDEEEMNRRVEGDLRGFGQALIGRLLKACLDRGIEPILRSSIQKLTVDRGRMSGAVIEKDGAQKTIAAKRGVILATGGFEWNEQLKKSFLRGPLDRPASPPTNTGDGLKLAMAAGADLGNMTSAWWVPTLTIPEANWPENGHMSPGNQTVAHRSVPVLIERTLPHTIMVNRDGRRFCNEANNYSSLAGAFHKFDPATFDYPNLPAFLILDHQYMSRYPLASVMPGSDIPEWIKSAESLDELATKIGVDGTQLQKTISDFNHHAEQAQDPQYGRGESAYDHFYGDRSREGAAATLGPINTAPYFAVEINSGALGTNGGARVNGSGQVLDVHGEPIAGLYGAGNVISCPTGSVYAGAGGTLGPALTFGYIAGRAAARIANQ